MSNNVFDTAWTVFAACGVSDANWSHCIYIQKGSAFFKYYLKILIRMAIMPHTRAKTELRHGRPNLLIECGKFLFLDNSPVIIFVTWLCNYNYVTATRTLMRWLSQFHVPHWLIVSEKETLKTNRKGHIRSATFQVNPMVLDSTLQTTGPILARSSKNHDSSFKLISMNRAHEKVKILKSTELYSLTNLYDKTSYFYLNFACALKIYETFNMP